MIRANMFDCNPSPLGKKTENALSSCAMQSFRSNYERKRKEKKKEKTRINKACRLARQNTPPPFCVPIDSVSQSATVGILCAHFVVLGLVTMNSKSAHLLGLPEINGTEDIIKNSIIMFLTFTVLLPLKTRI